MSTIKVNRIENTSTTDGGVSIDVDGHVTIDGQQLPTAGPLSNRNRIINGDMRIDQRNNGATIPTGNAGYSVDRWQTSLAVLTTFTYGRSTVSPDGFTNSLLHTVASPLTPAANNYMLTEQFIEGYNISDFNFGTASAVSVTVSFWVRSSVTGTYSVAIANNSSNRTYVTTYSINTANTWEYKSVTIPGDTAGTWNSDNSKGLGLKFDLGSGSDFVAASTNSWVTTNTFKAAGSTSLCSTSGATFYLTGVQLEVGSKATPFEHRSYGQELALCQRYCQKFNYTDSSYQTICFMTVPGTSTATDGRGAIDWHQEMRATPSVTSSAAGTFRWNGGGLADQQAGSISFNQISKLSTSTELTDSTSRSRTSGRSGWMSREFVSDSWILATAEL